MAWLGNWIHRIKVTIDSGDVDDTLTWFPVLVHLSSSCGKDSQDLTAVFNEIGANYQKIAITKSDGTTELYVEVEEWDNAGEQAWLWVSRNGWEIASDSDTDFYLYYDNNHADNTGYVGLPNSTVAEQIWDSSFVFVSHMQDDPDTSHVRDSTQYDNDGTKIAANEPIVTTGGKISDAQDFDGSNDYISIASNASLLNFDELTISFHCYPTLMGDGYFRHIVNKGWQTVGAFVFYFRITGQTLYWNIRDSVGQKSTGYTIPTVPNWYHVAGTYKRNDVMRLYLDSVGSPTTATLDEALTLDFPIRLGVSTNGFKGILDEVRISNVVRSSAWIKADYETQRDDFLSFGGVQSYILDIRGVGTAVFSTL